MRKKTAATPTGDRKKARATRRTHAFQVVVEQDEAGFFVAECPALKACYTQGRTYEEAIKNIRDVIGLCLTDLPLSPSARCGAASTHATHAARSRNSTFTAS